MKGLLLLFTSLLCQAQGEGRKIAARTSTPRRFDPKALPPSTVPRFDAALSNASANASQHPHVRSSPPLLLPRLATSSHVSSSGHFVRLHTAVAAAQRWVERHSSGLSSSGEAVRRASLPSELSRSRGGGMLEESSSQEADRVAVQLQQLPWQIYPRSTLVVQPSHSSPISPLEPLPSADGCSCLSSASDAAIRDLFHRTDAPC